MNTELSSKYDPSAVEATAYQVWLDEKCFHADPAKPGPAYTIVIPPPNVTGALHLGHAINNTLQDILTRAHRMMGFNTLWVPGIDHAGIATQAVVEKQLKEQENKTRHDVGREGLMERIWKWKEQYGDRILSQLQRLGCSCDWDRTRFTLDEMCAKAVRETFFKLFKDGLIYRGKRLVNWDTHLLTTISDDELYDEPVKTSLWSIKYPIDGTDDFVTVATTRPETMLADTAVAYHSSNPKAASFKGKSVRLPLTNRLIPMIEDDILVDPEFGTGYVKVTPAHDPNDYAVYQRHLGKPTEIAILNLMTPDGKVNDADPSWAKYTGLTFPLARKKIVEDLIAGGLHNPETDVKPHEANVKFSDRSKTAIQPYLSDQWFVKMAPLAEPALEVVREGKIKFYPERHAQQYLSWLGEKRDWPVSRQLWWGHRIPVWSSIVSDAWGGRSEDLQSGKPSARLQETIDLHVSFFTACGVASDIALVPESDEIQSWINICARSPDAEQAIVLLNANYSRQPAITGFSSDATRLANQLASVLEAPYSQDPDVLDTWFSSALWPHSTLGWPEQTPELARYYPTSVLLTGRDIITLWVARMVMMGMYNMGVERGSVERDEDKSAHAPRSTLHNPSLADRQKDAKELGLPFLDVAINPTILDGKGERMSKSKGNGVDPVDIIHSHGADALRFTLTNMATETQDARMPVQVVCPHCGERLPNPDSKEPVMTCGKCKKKLTRPIQNVTGTADAPLARMTSDRFDLGRNFCNKLWNACRFALSNLEADSARSVGSALADAESRVLHNVAVVQASPANTASAKADPTGAHEPIGAATRDEDLMLRSQGGDKLAFALLYERHKAGVTSQLKELLSDVEDIDSLCSEVFLRGFRFAATYKYPDSFSTWILTIARNVAMSQSIQRERGSSSPESETTFTLADRWIVARFHRAVEESNQALKAYRFDVYAKACYDFFWRDFCDWYVEAIKPAMKDPARAPQTANVLAAVLDGALRLMHPMIPFITETIWWRLNDIRPVRGLPGLLECPTSKRLVLAQWPGAKANGSEASSSSFSPGGHAGSSASSADNPQNPARPPGLNVGLNVGLNAGKGEDAETIFSQLQELIVAIRTVRNDYQVNPKQLVKVSIKSSADLAEHIEANRELIELLATCSLQAVGEKIPPVTNAVTANAAGSEVFVEGLIDPNAEKGRLTKELESEEKTVAALKGRMSNEAYMAKAPPKLVQQTQDQLAAAEAKVAKLKEAIAKLG